MRTAILLAAEVLVMTAVPLTAQAATALWVESPGTMILHDRVAGADKEIALMGARNEVLSAQLALRADADGAAPCSFEWTALVGPGGQQIARENITLFRAADVEVKHGSNDNRAKDAARARPLGMFPDALVPLIGRDGVNVANSITLEKEQTAAFWVDVRIPAGTPAGQYSGSIALKNGGAGISVPVKVTVVDVEIPADSTIPSMYNLRDYPHVIANVDSYVAEAMAHRLQPTSYHYMDQRQEYLDHYNPNGKGYVSILIWDEKKPTPERAKQIVDTLKRITAHLKERGLLERSFLQLKDEPDLNELPGILEVARMVLAEVPEWKGRIAETLSVKEGTELDKVITYHVRPLALYGSWSWRKMDGREEWDKRRAEGQQLMFYVSNNQGTPYPTFDINAPRVSFEPRVMAWAWWHEKAYGHLYWDLMFTPEWKLHQKFPPGDGQLIYPGDFTLPGAPKWVLVKDLKGPVISRRMKIFRQGIQEWEMLKMAERKFGYEKVQAIVTPIYTCMGTKDYHPDKPMWSYEEAAWDNARAQLLQLLQGRP